MTEMIKGDLLTECCQEEIDETRDQRRVPSEPVNCDDVCLGQDLPHIR